MGLSMISGFIALEGASVASGMGGSLPAWVHENDVRFTDTISLHLV